ncbi:MAG: hypothetical protein ACLTK0_11500 [Anaerovoracaceae bacterium]
MNEKDIQRTETRRNSRRVDRKSITVKDVFGRTYLFARDDSDIIGFGRIAEHRANHIRHLYGNLKSRMIFDRQGAEVLPEQSIGLSSPVHVSSGHSSVSALLGKETYRKLKRYRFYDRREGGADVHRTLPGYGG